MNIFDQLICVTFRPIIHLTVMAGSATVSTTSVCWGENFITDFVYLKHLINIDGWRYDLVLLLATVIGCLGNLLIVIILCKQQLGSKFRSEEHTSELQSPVPISYAVFCLKKKKKNSSNRHKIIIIKNSIVSKNT